MRPSDILGAVAVTSETPLGGQDRAGLADCRSQQQTPVRKLGLPVALSKPGLWAPLRASGDGEREADCSPATAEKAQLEVSAPSLATEEAGGQALCVWLA